MRLQRKVERARAEGGALSPDGAAVRAACDAGRCAPPKGRRGTMPGRNARFLAERGGVDRLPPVRAVDVRRSIGSSRLRPAGGGSTRNWRAIRWSGLAPSPQRGFGVRRRRGSSAIQCASMLPPQRMTPTSRPAMRSRSCMSAASGAAPRLRRGCGCRCRRRGSRRPPRRRETVDEPVGARRRRCRSASCTGTRTAMPSAKVRALWVGIEPAGLARRARRRARRR